MAPQYSKTVFAGSQGWEEAVGRGGSTGEGSGQKVTGRRGQGKDRHWHLRAEIKTRFPFPGSLALAQVGVLATGKGSCAFGLHALPLK